MEQLANPATKSHSPIGLHFFPFKNQRQTEKIDTVTIPTAREKYTTASLP